MQLPLQPDEAVILCINEGYHHAFVTAGDLRTLLHGRWLNDQVRDSLNARIMFTNNLALADHKLLHDIIELRGESQVSICML